MDYQDTDDKDFMLINSTMRWLVRARLYKYKKAKANTGMIKSDKKLK